MIHTYCISQNNLGYAAVTNSPQITVTLEPVFEVTALTCSHPIGQSKHMSMPRVKETGK